MSDRLPPVYGLYLALSVLCQASAAVLAARRELGDRATVQLFSALRRDGIDEAREVLDRWLTRAGTAK